MDAAAKIAVAILVAPWVGGLLKGIDRKLTARLQGRVGPPLIQPYYDFFKLLGKEQILATRHQMAWPVGFLSLVITSLVLLALGQDLLMIFLILGAAGVFLVLGALSVKSPYSQFGGHRELLQMFAYEPILLLVAFVIYKYVGSFMVEDIWTKKALLPHLWPAFIGLLFALVIKMRKSPFDIAASDHAHQEIVRGTFTEFSGPLLAVVELGHWYELAFLYCVLSLFWVHPLWAGALIALGSFLAVILLDNCAARLTYSLMIRLALGIGFGMVAINFAYLYAIG